MGSDNEAVSRPANGKPSDEDRKTIRHLLHQGDAFEAYDLLRTQRRDHPDDVGLRELEARALIGLGALEKADALLEELASAPSPSEEVLGLRASRCKSRALRETDPAARTAGLRDALALYQRAWEHTEGAWTGLNVATLHLVLGETDRARDVAEEVTRKANIRLGEVEETDEGAWLLATLAEAALIRGRGEEALRDYERLRHWVEPRSAWAMLCSARRSAHLLLEEAPDAPEVDRERLDALLATPPVLLAVGHMLDMPDRTVPRFPPALEPAVAEAMRDVLKETSASLGYSSLAGGTDILFQEALDDAGIPRFVMSPYSHEALRRESVERDDLPGWGERFDHLWATADRQCVVARHRFGWEDLCYEFANEMLTGLALMRADDLDTGVVGVAVWDGCRGDGRGGTQGTVRMWEERALLDRVVVRRPQDLAAWPSDVPRPASPDTAPSLPALTENPEFAPGRAAVAALLFADAKGFSSLDEDQISVFIEHVLGAAADVKRKYAEHVYESATWGDCVFFVIKDVEAAGNLALDLREAMRDRSEAFQQAGLPAELTLRIAVHAGPVHFVEDPVTGASRVSGAQVTTAARMEPITPPGEVYATEAFAALSRARQVRGYECHYVGKTALAKAYGQMPAYHVMRAPRRSVSPIACEE